MVIHKSFTMLTDEYNQLIPITAIVRQSVTESQVTNGIVTVVTMHTTTGITVNEHLECLASDLAHVLDRLAPEDYPYTHARMLHSYGSTAGNAPGHIKSMLVGNHCLFPIADGQVVLGDAQEIYFYEFDGPARRTYTITIIGETE